MSSRFFTTSIDHTAQTATLEDSEAHHLLHVMRLKPGEQVTLFDGMGNSWTAVITGTSRRSAELSLVEQISTASHGGHEIILAVAPPKGDRFRWLVEKATELGMDTLIPVETERTVVSPGSGKLDKLQQTMVAACKQCGRNQFMKFEPPISWQQCVDQYRNSHTILIAHPNGDHLRDAFREIEPTRHLLLAVGPEGGFTEEEVAIALRAGAEQVSLGTNLLRTETAAITFAAAARLW